MSTQPDLMSTIPPLQLDHDWLGWTMTGQVWTMTGQVWTSSCKPPTGSQWLCLSTPAAASDGILVLQSQSARCLCLAGA